MFYLLTKISPLPKYRTLYLKVPIHQILVPFDIFFLALSNLLFFFLAKYVNSSQVNGFRSNFDYLIPFLVNIQHKETRYLIFTIIFWQRFSTD